MNFADSVILILVVLIIALVVLNSIKKHRAVRRDVNAGKCSGCAYKGFCGKLPKE